MGFGLTGLFSFAALFIWVVEDDVGAWPWQSTYDYASHKIPTCASYAPREYAIAVHNKDHLDDYANVFLDKGWSNISTNNAYGDGFTMNGRCVQ